MQVAGADTGFEFGQRSHPMHEIEKAAKANFFVGLCRGEGEERIADEGFFVSY